MATSLSSSIPSSSQDHKIDDSDINNINNNSGNSNNDNVDFFSLLSRNHNHRPARVAQIIVRGEDNNPLVNDTTHKDATIANRKKPNFVHPNLLTETEDGNIVSLDRDDTTIINNDSYNREYQLQLILTGGFHRHQQQLQDHSGYTIIEDDENEDKGDEDEVMGDKEEEDGEQKKMDDSDEEEEEDNNNTHNNQRDADGNEILDDEKEREEKEQWNQAQQSYYYLWNQDQRAQDFAMDLLSGDRYDPSQEKNRADILEIKRKNVEQKLSSNMHEVELADWETLVNWNGIDDSSSNNNNNNNDYEPSQKNLLSQPFNPSLEAVDFSKAISWGGVDDIDLPQRKAKNIPLILQHGVVGRSVARLTMPGCGRPESFSQSIIFDQRVERASLNNSFFSSKTNKNSLATDNVALEKLIAEKQKKRAQMAIDKTHRVTEAMGTLALGPGRGRAITSSLMGPGGTERTGRPSRHGGAGNSAHDSEHVEQLDLVTNHNLVKPDLKKTELRQFHRPRLPKTIVKVDMPWQFQVRVFPHLHMSKGRSNRGDGSTIVGSYHHHHSSPYTKIRNEADLSPSDGMLVLFEYSEERPPLQLSKGMACRIKNFYRGDKSKCPISAGGGDRPTRKKDKKNKNKHNDNSANEILEGKFETPSRLSNQNKPISASELIGKIPVIDKQQQPQHQLQSSDEKKKKDANKILPEGVTEILHHKEHGPFIGEVDEGTMQSGLITNLFNAPIFLHEPDSTDFLMILGRKPGYKQPNSSLGVVLRPLPSSIYCVGQVEPRVKVFAPQTTLEKSFTVPFVTYQIAKALQRTQAKEKRGLRFDEINDRLFANTELLHNALRQRIKQVAQYDKNTQIWTLKDVGFEDFPGVPILGMKFSPEGVAAYEAECCAVQRLKDLGICELFSGSSSVTTVGAGMVYLNGALNAARERKSLMRRMVEVARRSKTSNKSKARQIALYERAADKLEAAWKEIKRKQEIARFIYEELQLAPWTLTAEFIDVHKQAQGTGMMRLTGLGDPSGLGEAYNFLREVDAKPNKGTGNSDGALNAQIKKITGTENDLRKLTMKQMASLLRSYGMPQKEIDKLKRWDRVHVIRDFSTRAASNGMGDGLEGYARGEKMKLSDQKQMYRDRIQEICRRQRAALSTDASPNEASRTANIVSVSGGEAIGDGDGTNGDHKNPDPLSGEMHDSDSGSEDDDDLAATFEEDFMDVQQTNQLVAAQIRGDSDGVALVQRTNETQELSMDARELAALKRQREEERAAQEGIGVTGSTGEDKNELSRKTTSEKVDRKVIRRRITKTHPDGTQTTTFKFVVLQGEVEKIIANMKKKENGIYSSKKNKDCSILENRYKSKSSKKDASIQDKRYIGHSIFEEEDDSDSGYYRTNIKLQFKKKNRVIKTKNHKRTGASSTSRSLPKLKKSPKMQMEKMKLKASREKKLKKRRREMEEADLYMSSAQRRGTNNRRERGSARDRMPHVRMADRLEQIRMQVEKRPGSVPFHRPVPRRTLPKYYVVISQPIDLQGIRDKNARYEYKTADAFLRDFDLMKNNAIKFNGVGSIIGNEATSIYEFVKETIEQHRDEFKTLEAAVYDQLNNGRKSKKMSKSSTPKSGAPALSNDKSNVSTTMNTANLVLCGVETTLNVGDLSSYGLGGGDSDSDGSIAKIAL